MENNYFPNKERVNSLRRKDSGPVGEIKALNFMLYEKAQYFQQKKSSATQQQPENSPFFLGLGLSLPELLLCMKAPAPEEQALQNYRDLLEEEFLDLLKTTLSWMQAHKTAVIQIDPETQKKLENSVDKHAKLFFEKATEYEILGGLVQSMDFLLPVAFIQQGVFSELFSAIQTPPSLVDKKVRVLLGFEVMKYLDVVFEITLRKVSFYPLYQLFLEELCVKNKNFESESEIEVKVNPDFVELLSKVSDFFYDGQKEPTLADYVSKVDEKVLDRCSDIFT